MIASFEHGFVFIKGKKVGGTSVEAALSPLCGADDVVTPLAVDEEIVRGFQARNFTDRAEIAEQFKAACDSGADPDYAIYQDVDRQLRQTGGFFAHMTAEECRDRLPRPFWRDALRFTVERHPYEKAVSQAYFSWRRADQAEGFDLFLDSMVRRGPFTNARFYMLGERVVAEVLRYDHLSEDLAAVCSRLGLPAPALPNLKSGLRSDRRPAAEILSTEQKAIVRDRCRREFDLFGFEP